MSQSTCDGCGRRISIAGGIANVWSFDERRATEGTAMTFDFADGSTHQLCFACIDRLPEEPTGADVDALGERDLEYEDGPVEEDPQLAEERSPDDSSDG